MPNALPVRRLQLVQWQTPCILGSPLTEIDVDPQAHCAIRVMVCSPRTYNVEVTGARLRTEDQGAMLHARPGTPPCYTAVDHLRLPLVGTGDETTYSTLSFTQLRNAFMSFKTAFGRTT